MSQLTIFLARSIGLFTVLLVAGFMARGGTVIEATVEDEAVMISYAIISLAMGVAMVVGHNVWSGGALPVVVTLVGWLILAKGFTLLVLAPRRDGRDGSADGICRALSPPSHAGAGRWAISDLGRVFVAISAPELNAQGELPAHQVLCRADAVEEFLDLVPQVDAHFGQGSCRFQHLT
jgi:hypothetical protein